LIYELCEGWGRIEGDCLSYTLVSDCRRRRQNLSTSSGEKVAVVGLRKRVAHLTGESRAHIVVVQRLLKVRHEGRREQYVVNLNDALILLDVAADDLSAGPLGMVRTRVLSRRTVCAWKRACTSPENTRMKRALFAAKDALFTVLSSACGLE
jgi:hypothetical protein